MKFLVIALIVGLAASTAPMCIDPNCGTCGMDVRACAACNTGFFLPPLTGFAGTCSQCGDANCLVCNATTTGSCQICQAGYALTSTKTCVTMTCGAGLVFNNSTNTCTANYCGGITGCVECNAARTACVACAVNGAGTASSLTTASTAACATTNAISNCYSATSASVCGTCNPGTIWIDAATPCVTTLSCTTYSAILTAFYASATNAALVTGLTASCTGTTLSATVTSCPAGYYVPTAANDCLACPTGTSTHIATCSGGAGLTAVSCTGAYFVNTGATDCSACTDAHALTCSSTASLTCAAGYFVLNGTCTACGTGANTCVDAAHALTCAANYALTIDPASKNVSCTSTTGVTTTLTNCALANTTFTVCFLCQPNYFNVNITAVSCGGCPANCALCSSATACTTCATGFNLTTNNTCANSTASAGKVIFAASALLAFIYNLLF